MPARVELRRVVLFVLVVDPARAQGEFLREVLVVFVAEAVGADKGAGFGVACGMGDRGLVREVEMEVEVEGRIWNGRYLPIYCI